MSYVEFLRWAAYRRKRGSLHPGLRADRATAPLTLMYANTHRNKGTSAHQIWDFLPHEEEPPITMERAMEAWR
ncbi:phage tail assembly protein T [Onishia taeanensis]|uniref:phage tail assembly protein T n=1 Tax=Onishia taeanensis TaxID=284577 RepID=UPI003BF4AE45